MYKLKNLSLSLFILAGTLITGCAATKRNSYDAGTTPGNRMPSAAIQKKFAALMGVSPSTIANGPLYEFVEKWLNTRYKYGSQSDKEIDCSGFTQNLYDAVYQVKLPRTSQAQYDAMPAIRSARALSEGDLVFFCTTKSNKVTHVGVYLQNNRFVNATTKGVLISDMNLPYWKESFVSGGKLRR